VKANSAVSSCSVRCEANRFISSVSLRTGGVPFRNRSNRYLGVAWEGSLVTVRMPWITRV
jgi:hypothetical protein